MKILHSWSSGKDSAWALHLLNQTHPGAVAGLLTTVNEAVDRAGSGLAPLFPLWLEPGDLVTREPFSWVDLKVA